MKIGVIGAGRLGLTFALLCELVGYKVLVSDVREDYVENLNKKICHTNEPHIQKLLSDSLKLTATTSNLEVIQSCELIFTFVATPSTDEGSYDTSIVFKITEEFIRFSESGTDISDKKFVIGCTTNPGDVDKVQNMLEKYGVRVAYNPEFIAQGDIVRGLEKSDIVLIGTKHTDLSVTLKSLYEQIQTIPINAKVMSPKAAEITKIGINCFLTNKISYANMIGEILIKSDLEEEVDIVLDAIGSDTRIGNKYMKFGFGFGGPCLPRDNRAIGFYSKNLGMDLNLPLNVDDFNKEHSNFLKNYYIKLNPNKSIPFTMEYVSYKKGTDILEESQQLKLCIDLLEEGYIVHVAEIDEILQSISNLVEKYDGRLKLFKKGENLEGFKINLL